MPHAVPPPLPFPLSAPPHSPQPELTLASFVVVGFVICFLSFFLLTFCSFFGAALCGLLFTLIRAEAAFVRCVFLLTQVRDGQEEGGGGEECNGLGVCLIILSFMLSFAFSLRLLF